MATLFGFIAGHAGVCTRCYLRERSDSAINTAMALYSGRILGFVCVCMLPTEGILQTLKESGLR